MRKIFFIALILLAAASLFAQQQAILKEFSGKVEILPPGKNWEPAAKNLVVARGATISTGFNSYATLDLGTSRVQVKPLTRMTLAELVKKEGEVTTTLNLRVGRVRAQVDKAEGLQNNFILRSSASTAAVRGTEFEYDAVRIKVIEGLVSFYNAANQGRSVGGGEESSVTGLSAPTGAEEALIATATTTITTTPGDAAAGGTGSKTSLGGTLRVTVR